MVDVDDESAAPATAVLTPAQQAAKKQQRRVLGIVFLTLFLDLLGFGIILPIQPFYAESFGASATVVTLVSATYSLMQFLFAPMWGRLSDRIGRRPVVLVSIAFACSGWLVLGFANGLLMLVMARMIAGFGNANLGTVHAIVADVTSPKDRARGMGLVGAAYGLGFLFGPVVGGIFGGLYGPQVPAFIAAGLAAANFLVALRFLPETRRGLAAADAPTATSTDTSAATSSGPSGATVVVDKGHHRRTLFPLDAMAEAWRMPSVAPLLVMGLIFTIGFAMMESALSLFVEREFLDASLIGTVEGGKRAAGLTTQVFVAVGLTGVIVQGGLIRAVRKRYREKSLILVGCILMGVSFAGIAAIPFLSWPFLAMFPLTVVFAAGSGVFQPSASSLLSRSVDEDRQGSVLGVGHAVQSLGRIIGPGSAGFLLDIHRSLPLFVPAVLMLVVAALATRVKTRDD